MRFILQRQTHSKRIVLCRPKKLSYLLQNVKGQQTILAIFISTKHLQTKHFSRMKCPFYTCIISQNVMIIYSKKKLHVKLIAR